MIRASRIFAFTVISLLLSSSSIDAQVQSVPLGSVSGQVTEKLTGRPIAGATVVVTHVPSGTTSTQTTDSAGGFNASGLRLGGPFTVAVTADGYESAEQEIGFLTAGQAQRISVSLADVGKTITVTASYTDGQGTAGHARCGMAGAQAAAETLSRYVAPVA